MPRKSSKPKEWKSLQTERALRYRRQARVPRRSPEEIVEQIAALDDLDPVLVYRTLEAFWKIVEIELRAGRTIAWPNVITMQITPTLGLSAKLSKLFRDRVIYYSKEDFKALREKQKRNKKNSKKAVVKRNKRLREEARERHEIIKKKAWKAT